MAIKENNVRIQITISKTCYEELKKKRINKTKLVRFILENYATEEIEYYRRTIENLNKK